MQFLRTCGALLVGLSTASVANATLLVSFKPVPISAGAMTDDPQLKETATSHPLARTFEMDLTQGSGEKWSFATIRTTLNAGSFYIPTTGNNHFSQEAIWNNVGDRHLQNDTFVTTPHGGVGYANASIAGKSDYPTNQTGPADMPGNVPGFLPTVNNTPSTIDVSWGDQSPLLNALPDGTYMIARFTTLGMASSDMVGHYGGTQHSFIAVNYDFSIPLPFDFNHDGVADDEDIGDALTVLQGHTNNYFAEHPDLDTNYLTEIGDLNGDGAVNRGDIEDYIYILDQEGFGDETAPLAALAPEPGSFLLIGIAGIGLLRRGRSRPRK